MSDPLTLEETITTLSHRTSSKRGIVVLDAGIATEDNLEMLNEKGYLYIHYMEYQ